jgi:hypothetical protein
MREGAICVAGIDPETGKHVRPLTPAYQKLDRSALRRNGGPFGLGVVVDLGRVEDVGAPPEIEDRRVNLRSVRVVGTMPPPEFWSLLMDSSCWSLSEVFGPALTFAGGRAFCEEGEGAASLGLILPGEPPCLRVDDRGAVRIALRCGGGALDLSVTDIRLYDDQDALKPDVLAEAGRRLDGGERLVLAVGLTRPFAPKTGGPARHWLQVNGLHFEDGRL